MVFRQPGLEDLELPQPRQQQATAQIAVVVQTEWFPQRGPSKEREQLSPALTLGHWCICP